MSVTVRIPTPLRKVTNGADKAEVEAGALSAIMSSLNNQFPGIRERPVSYTHLTLPTKA